MSGGIVEAIVAIASVVSAGTAAYGAYEASQAPSTPDYVAPPATISSAVTEVPESLTDDTANVAKDKAATLEAAAKKKRQSYAQIATSPGGILTKAPIQQKQLSTVLG